MIYDRLKPMGKVLGYVELNNNHLKSSSPRFQSLNSGIREQALAVSIDRIAKRKSQIMYFFLRDLSVPSMSPILSE